MVNKKKMLAQLELHEGLRQQFYVDTLGNTTVGIGFNVTSRSVSELQRLLGRAVNSTGDITAKEARDICTADIKRVEAAIQVHFPQYSSVPGLNEVRQRVMVDMAFNLGFRALNFTKTLAAIREHNWSVAAREIYRSKWALQVDDGPGGHFGRADRLAKMLLTGEDYAS